MLERCDSRDLTEKLECWKLDPLGCFWRPAGIISAAVMNSQCAEKKPYKEEHFIAGPDPELAWVDDDEEDLDDLDLEEQSAEDAEAIYRTMGM